MCISSYNTVFKKGASFQQYLQQNHVELMCTEWVKICFFSLFYRVILRIRPKEHISSYLTQTCLNLNTQQTIRFNIWLLHSSYFISNKIRKKRSCEIEHFLRLHLQLLVISFLIYSWKFERRYMRTQVHKAKDGVNIKSLWEIVCPF